MTRVHELLNELDDTSGLLKVIDYIQDRYLEKSEEALTYQNSMRYWKRTAERMVTARQETERTSVSRATCSIIAAACIFITLIVVSAAWWNAIEKVCK